MKVIVLGGGVVGVTTAYQLQRDGHDVTVIDRQPMVAAETSWGNAGMVAPGHSFVWSSPKAPMILLKSLVLRDQALRFKFSADPRLYSWSWLFLMECNADKARRNTLLKHRLAAYSQSVLQDVIKTESVSYDRNDRGIIYFHRSQEALDRGVAQMKILESDGQLIKVLNRDEVVLLDPSLSSAKDEIVGAIYCPTDETGDSAKFTRALAEIIVSRGATVLNNTNIQALDVAGGQIAGVRTDKGVLTGDAYVLALGSYSPILARQIGIKLPIYPVKGYSRFGDRIRVTATAEFAGYNTTHKPSDFEFMKRVTQELYPDGGDYDRAEMWAGLRPMTPTNLPFFGQRKYGNLYLNTGHGHIGWTMSHGSARITADLIAGRMPAIPMDGLVP
jgi:D-amino-acid dehydrogenase